MQLVLGSMARAVTGTESTAVHSHSLLTGLLWILRAQSCIIDQRGWVGGCVCGKGGGGGKTNCLDSGKSSCSCPPSQATSMCRAGWQEHQPEAALNVEGVLLEVHAHDPAGMGSRSQATVDGHGQRSLSASSGGGAACAAGAKHRDRISHPGSGVQAGLVAGCVGRKVTTHRGFSLLPKLSLCR